MALQAIARPPLPPPAGVTGFLYTQDEAMTKLGGDKDPEGTEASIRMWLQDSTTGEPISDMTLALIHSEALNAAKALHGDPKTLPPTWVAIKNSVEVQLAVSGLEAKFPDLACCEGHWKAMAVLQTKVSRQRRNAMEKVCLPFSRSVLARPFESPYFRSHR
jgi:hypothetical protein